MLIKKLLPLLAVIAFAITAHAQMPDNTKVYTVVDSLPKFQGGDNDLLAYLGKNIHYPELARDCGCTGTLYLTFVIDETGAVSNPYVLKPISGCYNLLPSKKLKKNEDNPCWNSSKEMSKEALRVINSMPKWKPGILDGKYVKVQYNLPVKFTLR